MSSSPWPRRVVRLVGGLLGAAATAAVLIFLLLAGAVAWVFTVSLPNHQREIAEAERESAWQAAAKAETALGTAARDGKLTDTEIRSAVGGPGWEADRAERSWTVRARFEATDPLCFAYVITPSRTGAVAVTRTELPDCPVFGGD